MKSEGIVEISISPSYEYVSNKREIFSNFTQTEEFNQFFQESSSNFEILVQKQLNFLISNENLIEILQTRKTSDSRLRSEPSIKSSQSTSPEKDRELLSNGFGIKPFEENKDYSTEPKEAFSYKKTIFEYNTAFSILGEISSQPVISSNLNFEISHKRNKEFTHVIETFDYLRLFTIIIVSLIVLFVLICLIISVISHLNIKQNFARNYFKRQSLFKWEIIYSDN
jgi:hypothetical protein